MNDTICIPPAEPEQLRIMMSNANLENQTKLPPSPPPQSPRMKYFEGSIRTV